MAKKIEAWEAQSAANTLMEAEKIKANKPLLRAASKEIGAQQAAIEKAMNAGVAAGRGPAPKQRPSGAPSR